MSDHTLDPDANWVFAMRICFMEKLLMDIHWASVGQWQPEIYPSVSHSDLLPSNVTVVPSPCAPGHSVTGVSPPLPSTPTGSQLRRQRAKRTKKRMWLSSRGLATDGESGEEKTLQCKRTRKELSPAEAKQSNNLNISAPPFVPQCDRLLQELLSPAAEAVEVTASHTKRSCAKCLESVSECVCLDVFCRRCYMLATHCSCNNAILKKRICKDCGAVEDVPSLFDVNFDVRSIDVERDFVCSECSGIEYTEGDWNCMESAKSCQLCYRVGYHDFAWCEGDDCQGESLFHTNCMSRVGNRLLCGACCERHDERHDESPAGDDSAEAEPSTWSAEEIQIWIRVTCRLAGKAYLGSAGETKDTKHGDDQWLSILHQRWEQAVPHLPNDLRSALWDMLLEERPGNKSQDTSIENPKA